MSDIGQTSQLIPAETYIKPPGWKTCIMQDETFYTDKGYYIGHLSNQALKGLPHK